MGKYRTQQLFVCPYCNIAGWFRRGQRDNHINKSHKDKQSISGTGIDERLAGMVDRFTHQFQKLTSKAHASSTLASGTIKMEI
jgi:hypothetical protein